MRWRLWSSLLVPLLSLVAGHEPIAQARATDQTGAGANWTQHGGDADETDYSVLSAINTRNVNRLGLAWSLELPGEVSLEGTPLAVDGVLYFTGSYGTVYAVDAVTGRLRWSHDPQIWKHHPARMRLSFGVNRGVAYEGGRVFSATLDGRLLALDAASGRLLWEVETLAPDALMYITGAPRAYHGKVVIGQGGADFGSRGYVTAYDAVTGRQLWRFYLAPGTPAQKSRRSGDGEGGVHLDRELLEDRNGWFAMGQPDLRCQAESPLCGRR